MKRIKVKITFTEKVLGSQPADKEVFATYVASKHPEGTPARDELESADKIEETGTTVFPRNDDGVPALWDYQVKGFFKAACTAIRRGDDFPESQKLKACKSVIDTGVYVYPRQLTLNIPEGKALGICERPLRAETMQGPRVALARSESAPAGTWFECEVEVLNNTWEKAVIEWLEQGQRSGLGQWRNSGCGRFKYEIVS